MLVGGVRHAGSSEVGGSGRRVSGRYRAAVGAAAARRRGAGHRLRVGARARLQQPVRAPGAAAGRRRDVVPRRRRTRRVRVRVPRVRRERGRRRSVQQGPRTDRRPRQIRCVPATAAAAV